MSLTPTAPSGPSVRSGPSGPSGPSGLGSRRVRHQARDVAVMMVFSAASSVAVATGFLLLAQLSHQGR